MNDDLRTLLLSAASGLLIAASIIYCTGFDGSVGGVRIGPSAPWLRVAGR